MNPAEKHDIVDRIEENDEVLDDKDGTPEQDVAIELPVEPDDPNGQPI